jgi:hypothetical protein
MQLSASDPRLPSRLIALASAVMVIATAASAQHAPPLSLSARGGRAAERPIGVRDGELPVPEADSLILDAAVQSAL